MLQFLSKVQPARGDGIPDPADIWGLAMQGIRPQSVLLLLGLLFLPLTCPAEAGQQHKQSKHAVKQPPPQPEQAAPAPQVPPPPPRPLTLEERPAAPPQVVYHDGLLTIVAPNSTLGDILRAVRAQTGAVIDMPVNTNERVVSHFGPGPARDVVAELLHGTDFNYAILGSPSDANALERVILTSKSSAMLSDSQPQPNSMAGQTGFPQQSRMPFARGPQAAATNNDDNDDSDSDSSDEQMNQPGAAEPGEPNQQPVKTPEQLLQELQRQQQQLQQQQQQPGAPQAIPIVPPRPSGPPQQ